MINKKDRKSSRISVDIYIYSAIGVVVIFVFSGFYYVDTVNNEKFLDLASFGNYLGGTLSPLFAFLALIALLYSIQIQSEELQDTIETLVNQNELIQKQNFEATFFQMLKLYNEITQEIAVKEIGENPKLEGKILKGREAIEDLYETLFKDYFDEIQYCSNEELKADKYEEFYRKFAGQIGHYFRIIYNILKFVDKSEMPYEKRKFYTNILRAQLSDYELILLFYNVIYFRGEGERKMREFVIPYNLLKHINRKEDGMLLDYYSDITNLEQIDKEYKLHRSKNSKEQSS